MKSKRQISMGLLGVILLAVACLPAAGVETREYLLGDLDNFHYDGPGSVDDVYVDPALLAILRERAPSEPNDHFDVLNDNNNVPFTFLFPLASGEEVTGATLTLGLRATASLVTNDSFTVNSDPDPAIHWKYKYPDLGWLPIPNTGTNARSVDLSDILGDNHLPLLQNGQLNATITDDTAVDYAILTLEVGMSPAPGDADLDGDVDLDDLFLVRNNYGGPGGWGEGDFSGDGFVGLADLFDVRNNFTGSLSAVPEPVTLSWLALGALALLRHKRRPVTQMTSNPPDDCHINVGGDKLVWVGSEDQGRYD